NVIIRSHQRASTRSPSARGRGSKRDCYGIDSAVIHGRPPREGVDRNLENGEKKKAALGRPPREGVDRNFSADPLHCETDGRPPGEGVDRNVIVTASIAPLSTVALRARAWIETLKMEKRKRPPWVALRARAWIETFQPTRSIARRMVALRARAWIETTRISS